MSVIKKNFILMLVLTLVFSSTFTNTVINADEGPSFWAVEEVEQAESEGIVPDMLQIGYQQNIKRYEYVLLAIELLDIKNDQVSISTKYPFTDIYDHVYEDEIVKAFNAGIIKGNGDGTFRPDDSITREEIASLVVNLVKRLDKVDSVNTSSKTTYSDGDQISFWANGYINYCYNMGIMNGVGKDDNGKDEIDPLGQATREQAMILLYRLANNKGLLSSTDLGTIGIYQYPNTSGTITEKQKVQSTKINDFAKVFGQGPAKELISLSQLENVEITNLREDSVVVYFVNEGKIVITNDGFTTDATLETLSVNNTDLIDAYTRLVYQLSGNDLLSDALTRDLNVFANDSEHEESLVLSDNESYSSRTEQRDEFLYYIFEYQLTSK